MTGSLLLISNNKTRFLVSSIFKLLIVILGMLSIVTCLGSFSNYSSLVNRVLMGAYLVLLFFLVFFSGDINIQVFTVFFVLTTIIDICITGFDIHQLNDVFYLPLWVMNLLIVSSRYDSFKKATIQCHRFLFIISILWNLITLISFAFPSVSFSRNSYDVAFWGFCGQSHRFAGTALFALIGPILEFILTKKKSKLVFIILPIISILLCDARTYIAIALFVNLYVLLIFFKNKKSKKFIFLICTIIIIYVIIYYTLIRINANKHIINNHGFMHFITSGRSTFWKIDIDEFFKKSLFNIVFGNGYNFVYETNKKLYGSAVWAHNDFINILLANGFLGLYIYFYVFIKLFKEVSKRKKIDKLYRFIFFSILFINASFNMLYTYTISNLITPLLAVIMLDISSENGDKIRL